MGRDSPREHAIFRGEISFDVDEAFNSRAAIFSQHQKANQTAHAGNDEKHWFGKERLTNEVCQFGQRTDVGTWGGIEFCEASPGKIECKQVAISQGSALKCGVDVVLAAA